jgi:hypothetical protein
MVWAYTLSASASMVAPKTALFTGQTDREVMDLYLVFVFYYSSQWSARSVKRREYYRRCVYGCSTSL